MNQYINHMMSIRWLTNDNLHRNQLAPHPHHNHTTSTPQPHHTNTTTAPQPHHTNTTPSPQPFKVSVVWLWCGCGVGVVWLAPQPHHTNFKRLWCWCGVGVVLVWCELVWVKVVTYGPPYLAIRVMVPTISAPEVRTKQRQPRHSSSRCQTCLAVTA